MRMGSKGQECGGRHHGSRFVAHRQRLGLFTALEAFPGHVRQMCVWMIVNDMVRNAFLTAIEQRFQFMQRYEDKGVQREALALIPVLLLEQRAQERMRMLQRAVLKGESDDLNISMQELLLLELLAWFKESFFEWVNSPECEHCSADTQMSHTTTDPQLLAGAERAEVYRCQACGKTTLFRRHTDPAVLLETREGRCGEWASTFTLLCRALGWETRWVCSETDHVWVEVFSLAQRRWLHCDPCENACDTPLLYESGWAAPLSYVLAYTHDDVQDVTWRYSAHHAQTLRRRNKCTEPELVHTLLQLRGDRQRQLTPARRHYVTRRCALELVELMLERQPTDEDQQGRTSGSLAWRLKRGETHALANGKVWRATAEERAAGRMTVRYSCALDRYERPPPAGSPASESVDKWEHGVFSARAVFRKEERDWKVVYLCRNETAADGEVQWRFEPGTADHVISSVSVDLQHAVFENGRVEISLCGERKCIKVPSGTQHLETNDFSGSQHLVIKARLCSGTGQCAWQHAQLFRQPSSARDSYPFSVTVTFKASSVQFHESS